MILRYSAAALAQLDRITAYLVARDPQAAKRVIDAIRSRATSLEEFPNTGRTTRVKNVRVAVEITYGYIISYQVSAKEVAILDIRHGRRRRYRPKRRHARKRPNKSRAEEGHASLA